MTAKDGTTRRPRRLRPRGRALIALAMALLLPGCQTSHYWNPPQPTVEQLMREAILESATRRVQQDAIVEEAAFLTAEQAYEEPAGDGEGYVAHAQHLEPSDKVRQPEPLPAPPGQARGPLINEEFFETDLREAISILAAEVEADVILDDRVNGVVNTTIRDATFDEALEKVLLPLGFVVGRRGEQYIVCEPDPESPLFPYVSTHLEYRPRHLNATDLLEAPPAQMRRFVRVVEQANALVVEAPTQFIDVITERIRSLDQPVPQVELEAIVCVVQPDSGFRFGLDWEHAVELDGETAFSAGVTGLGISGQVSGRGLRELLSDFSTTSSFVRLLADNGYLTIRASPRVMAQDGEKANIRIGRQTFFSVQPGGANSNSPVFFSQEIREIQAGIELEITPRIHDRQVTVQIAKAEVSEEVSASTLDLAGNAFPVINRRSVSTTVNVEDGKTIIIGGLVQRETLDRVNRVPGLSRLPGVGYLFKSVDHEDREAEVVIFISPRIVRPQGCGPDCDPNLNAPLEFPPP